MRLYLLFFDDCMGRDRPKIQFKPFLLVSVIWEYTRRSHGKGEMWRYDSSVVLDDLRGSLIATLFS